MGNTCCGSHGSCGPRYFLTREEKVDMLKDYKKMLEREAEGVAEKIKELEKNS